MRLIAYRQLTGSYGTVAAGKEFEADDDIALQLIEQGKAVKADPPKIEYMTKVIVPEAPEIGPLESGKKPRPIRVKVDPR
jgi:hypothetical protein